MTTTAAEPTGRQVEEALFKRMEEGDTTAKWELFDRQKHSIKQSAYKFAGANFLLRERLETQAIEVLDKALESYDISLERRETFGNWFRLYLGMHFKKLVRGEQDTWQFPTEDVPVPDIEPVGKSNGSDIFDPDMQLPEDSEISIPNISFLKPEVEQMYRLLCSGYERKEIQSMMGISDELWRHRITLIKGKLEDAGYLN